MEQFGFCPWHSTELAAFRLVDPLLDLPFVSNVFDMVMYVDDMTLFRNMDNNVDEHVINNELCKISEWLGAIKLS